MQEGSKVQVFSTLRECQYSKYATTKSHEVPVNATESTLSLCLTAFTFSLNANRVLFN